ncbi:MAG: potassium channel family protein [Sphingomicrobium sp.]
MIGPRGGLPSLIAPGSASYPTGALLLTLVVAALLVALCFAVHLAVMERLARRVYRHEVPLRHPLRPVLLSLFAAHLVEVLLFAATLSAFDWAGYGTLAGAVSSGPDWFVDHFYFSISSYTTLGIGDIVAQGPIRLLVGVEALLGLVLVAWSASFAYLVMERIWGTRG